MPRSDISSDPEDGSITSDEEYDPQAVGPTSPSQDQKPKGPWQQQRAEGGSLERIISKQPTSPIQPLPSSMPSRVTGPNARFRSLVYKVIKMNKMSLQSEPGIDPRRESAQALYGHIHQECTIEVIDYGPTKSQTQSFTNSQFVDHLASDEKKVRPLWSKVRWISIGGVSWDVIRPLAIKYNLHPLAIEDVLHGRITSRSKADYYSKHLFIRLISHTLREDSPASSVQVSRPSGTFTVPRAESPVDDFKTQNGSEAPNSLPFRRGPFSRRKTDASQRGIHALAGAGLTSAHAWGGGDIEAAWNNTNTWKLSRKGTAFSWSTEEKKEAVNQATIDELKKEERVNVELRNLFLFLFRDGTFITIHQNPGKEFFGSITARLKQRDTLLRSTSDASLLLQAVLDLVVDNGKSCCAMFEVLVANINSSCEGGRSMKTVRYLHIASGDLTMHKRTLSPLKSLIYGLRRYDLDRCIAQANAQTPGFDERQVTGFISHKAKVYLADVMDHTEYILASLDMFETIAENLIAYTFNLVAYETNSTMCVLYLRLAGL
ncbi:hypothetical protein FRC02_004253 [Tulasnella sp. 418]|nr:hypothetical protein FRC02_004253 [Tulasnella sp. 418]